MSRSRPNAPSLKGKIHVVSHTDTGRIRDHNEDAAAAFLAGKDGFLPWSYGLEITKLVMAGYMSAERQKTIDLTDPVIQQELETYIPLIQQGRGADILHVL